MPQRLNLQSQDSDGDLPHLYEEIDAAEEHSARLSGLLSIERAEVKRTASICVATIKGNGIGFHSVRAGPRLSIHLGGSRNLLVDLDKIEKTAGKTKLRRRNSITIGELWEANELNLENSRNGVIHPSLMHHNWRRQRFQALYQAMKRKKMLARLQRQKRVPEEVNEAQKEIRAISKKRPSSSRQESTSPRTTRPLNYNGRVVTLQKMTNSPHSESPEIYVLNSSNEPQVLLAATKVKLAEKAPSDVGSDAAGSPRTWYGGSGLVFLTRHGEREDHVNPKWYLNAPNIFDPPLSVKGFRQASELGIRLKKEKITHIVSSPFTRTIQTAIEVAKHLNLKIHIDIGLGEHMETKQFQVTCRRLQLDPHAFKVQVNTHEELLKRYPEFISTEGNLPEIKLNKWPAMFPEEEEQLFERTNNTVKHMGLFAFEHKANVLLVSHQTPVEYMAFELSSGAEDKFVSVCCLTKAAPRKNDPKKKGWKLIFQHEDSFLSEPECGKR